jgi:hypothetical protein
MPNLTADQIISRVRSWSLLTDTTEYPSTMFDDIMNWQCKELARKFDLWLCEETGTMATVAGSREVAFHVRLSRPVVVYYSSSGSRIELDYLTKPEFDEKYPLESSSSGDPVDFTIWGQNLLVGPTPTSVLTLYCDGYFYPEVIRGADFSGVIEENTFTNHADDLVMWLVLDKLVEYGFMEDTRGGLFRREAQLALDAILTEGRARHNLARRTVSQIKG